MTFSLLGIGVVIILEGALDFLGYGIPAPEASWGSMIATGQQVLTAQPEYVLIPSIVLLITVVALNTLGDALRERWGVSVQRRHCFSVEDLRVAFAAGGREIRAVDGVSYRVEARPDPGHHRRVRFGQDRRLPRDHGPAAPRPPRSAARPGCAAAS